jgi:hypothetical protein
MFPCQGVYGRVYTGRVETLSNTRVTRLLKNRDVDAAMIVFVCSCVMNRSLWWQTVWKSCACMRMRFSLVTATCRSRTGHPQHTWVTTCFYCLWSSHAQLDRSRLLPLVTWHRSHAPVDHHSVSAAYLWSHTHRSPLHTKRAWASLETSLLSVGAMILAQEDGANLLRQALACHNPAPSHWQILSVV